MPDTKVALEESQAGLNSAKLKTIADKADIIVNGYAFTRNDERIQVLNLNCPEKAVVFSTDGEVLETTMDDIELSIASRYLQQNKKYMEEWTMPKYYDFKVAGYYLYFTSFCVVECMHVHASDSKLTEGGSAKFFVKSTGDAVLQNRGILNDREIARISEFIKDHYQEMYLRWSQYSSKGYYEK